MNFPRVWQHKNVQAYLYYIHVNVIEWGLAWIALWGFHSVSLVFLQINDFIFLNKVNCKLGFQLLPRIDHRNQKNKWGILMNNIHPTIKFKLGGHPFPWPNKSQAKEDKGVNHISLKKSLLPISSIVSHNTGHQLEYCPKLKLPMSRKVELLCCFLLHENITYPNVAPKKRHQWHSFLCHKNLLPLKKL